MAEVESIHDILQRLRDTKLSDADDVIDVGDGLSGNTDVVAGTTISSSGSLLAVQARDEYKPFEPSAEIMEQAREINVNQGTKELYLMASPELRRIGFPFPAARDGQLQLVDTCSNALKAGRYNLLEAPTGAGKSPIEIALASQVKTAWLLIGRNDLVDQWERDFESFRDFGFYKARHRFSCHLAVDRIAGRPFDCSAGKAICKKERANRVKQNNPAPPCNYMACRDTALAKPFTVMTLSLGMTIFKYLEMHPGVQKRDLLVIDETSELESEIMGFFAFQLSTRLLMKIVPTNETFQAYFPAANDAFYKRWKVLPTERVEDCLAKIRPSETNASTVLWALDVAQIAKARLAALQYDPKDADIDPEVKNLAERCEQVIRQALTMSETMQSNVPYYSKVEEVHQDDKMEGHYTVRICPMEARGLFDRLFGKFFDKVIFVSATTGTAEMFRDAHGIKDPVTKIVGPSTFPPINRPIYIKSAGNMSMRTQEAEAPAVMKAMADIANWRQPNHPHFDHVNQKGVIHTYNNKITDMVVKHFEQIGQRHRLMILRGGGEQRKLTLDVFLQHKEPKILVSPSAMLGLSLADDLGRWQIIVKIPYANLGDPSVEHRKNNIPDWYSWQTAKDLIQTFGRVVRSPDDWGHTYVLDSAWDGFFQRSGYLFPAYIHPAIVRMP